MGKYIVLILLFLTNDLISQEIEWTQPVSFGSASHWVQTYLLTTENLPIICFKSHLGPLYFVIAKDECGQSWEEPQEIAGSTIQYPSMAIIAGHPTTTYHDQENDNLIYIRADDSRGSSWTNYMTLDTTGNVGLRSNLKIINDKPAIAYSAETNNCGNYLKYIIAKDSHGSSWNEPVELYDLSCGWGGDIILESINNKPIISIQASSSSGEHVIFFFNALDNDGLQWSEPITIAKKGWPKAVSVIKNKIIVFFIQRKGLGFYLACTRSLDLDGLTWDMEIDTLDYPFGVGSKISIVDRADHLIFSMSGATTSDTLSYAVFPKDDTYSFRDSGIIESPIFSSVENDLEEVCGKMGIVYLTRGQLFYSLSSAYPTEFRADDDITTFPYKENVGIIHLSNLPGDLKVIGITDSNNNELKDVKLDGQTIDMRSYPAGIYNISVVTSEGTFISIYKKE